MTMRTNETRYTIKEAAHILGVHPETLRRYEQRGIISPERTPETGEQRGHRRYTEADIDYLRGKK